MGNNKSREAWCINASHHLETHPLTIILWEVTYLVTPRKWRVVLPLHQIAKNIVLKSKIIQSNACCFTGATVITVLMLWVLKMTTTGKNCFLFPYFRSSAACLSPFLFMIHAKGLRVQKGFSFSTCFILEMSGSFNFLFFFLNVLNYRGEQWKLFQTSV